MHSTLRAGFFYFLVVFAIGFVFGTIRVLLAEPIIGELMAVVIEVPLMLLAAWFVCARLVTRFQVAPDTADRFTMGAVALALLLAAELVLSVMVFGNPAGAMFAGYLTLHGIVGLFGQLAFASFPLLQCLKK